MAKQRETCGLFFNIIHAFLFYNEFKPQEFSLASVAVTDQTVKYDLLTSPEKDEVSEGRHTQT